MSDSISTPMVKGVEALALAIWRFEGNSFQCRNYRNANPGNLRESPLEAGVDGQGYAYFPNVTAGYLALLRDLYEKFSGKSGTHLTPRSTIYDLLSVYAPVTDGNYPVHYSQFVAGFMGAWRGLSKGPQTPLGEIWTPEQGLPWDSQLNSYLKI